MKISASEQPDVKGTTFNERVAAFLPELKRFSSPLDLPTVWLILRTVREAAPEAFQAFAKKPHVTDRNLRKQYARQNKVRLDAECYAGFLHALYCWQLAREGRDAMEIVHKGRALQLHGKWKEMEFPRDAWLDAQRTRRKRMGLGPLTRTEFRRLETDYEKDTKRGRAFRALVTRILTGKALPITPFYAEELTQMMREADDPPD